jgi:protein-S-isoprenylcysteine O-methyltransferase Ste14
VTNQTKWFIAVPFSLIVSIAIPALISGEILWFIGRWAEMLYVFLTFSMWVIATAFVDLDQSRSTPDLANRLVPIGLILSVPISVWDRTNWIASSLPNFVGFFGAIISILAIFIGLISRQSLGRSYSPRPSHPSGSFLIQGGPYQWIRHPLYLAALLWVFGWPLIISSFLGVIIGLCFVLPAIYKRMVFEEADLYRIYGEEYAEYQAKTWRLVPYIY